MICPPTLVTFANISASQLRHSQVRPAVWHVHCLLMSCLLILLIKSTHKSYYLTWQLAYLTSGEPPTQNDSIRCVYIQLLIEEIQFLWSAFLSHSVFLDHYFPLPLTRSFRCTTSTVIPLYISILQTARCNLNLKLWVLWKSPILQWLKNKDILKKSKKKKIFFEAVTYISQFISS